MREDAKSLLDDKPCEVPDYKAITTSEELCGAQDVDVLVGSLQLVSE